MFPTREPKGVDQAWAVAGLSKPEIDHWPRGSILVSAFQYALPGKVPPEIHMNPRVVMPSFDQDPSARCYSLDGAILIRTYGTEYLVLSKRHG